MGNRHLFCRRACLDPQSLDGLVVSDLTEEECLAPPKAEKKSCLNCAYLARMPTATTEPKNLPDQVQDRLREEPMKKSERVSALNDKNYTIACFHKRWSALSAFRDEHPFQTSRQSRREFLARNDNGFLVVETNGKEFSLDRKYPNCESFYDYEKRGSRSMAECLADQRCEEQNAEKNAILKRERSDKMWGRGIGVVGLLLTACGIVASFYIASRWGGSD